MKKPPPEEGGRGVGNALILAVPFGIERAALILAVPYGESGAPILRAERGSDEYAIFVQTPSVTARAAVPAPPEVEPRMRANARSNQTLTVPFEEKFIPVVPIKKK